MNLKILITVFCLITLSVFSSICLAETFSIPNSGSPYVNLKNAKDNQIIHLPTGISVSVDQLLDTISSSRVIYIGETHDNLEAHRVQLEIIRRLYGKYPGRIAIGMEMFRRSAQGMLDRWHMGTLPDHEFQRLFRQNWGNSYKTYQTIFNYLKQARIPLIGLKSTEETQNQLRKNSLDISIALGFPEMDLEDVYHKDHTMAVFGGHSGPSGKSTSAYRMMVLWEETMAETVANFLKKDNYNDWKMVVLAGGFHVQYGFGIPKRAFRRIPHDYSIILPTVTHIPKQLESRQMEVEVVPIPLYAADFAWKVSYKVLPANRIKLGVFLKELENGLLVKNVGEGSNAAKAGIQKDDVLLQLDGQQLSGQNDLVDRLQLKKIGDKITLKLRRNNKHIEVQVSLYQLPK